MTPAIYIIMGVSGAGKSTIAEKLSVRLGLNFLDADDFHPESNIAKMSAGIPLTDADREPWLCAIADALTPGTVLACSALRRPYRDLLRAAAGGPARFVLLDAPASLTRRRLAARAGHFMPVDLLDSQCAELEPLGADENDGVVIDNSGSLSETLAQILSWIGQQKTLDQAV